MQTDILRKPQAATRFHIATAEAYELAAQLHRKAAHHRDRGEHREANSLAASARLHSQTGDEQSRAAGEQGD